MRNSNDRRPKEAWFGARAVFQHTDMSKRRGASVFEERVVLLRARSDSHAIRLAESEARKYARGLAPGCKYLGYIDVFSMFDAKVGHGSEIYSLMRDSRLKPKIYLDRFFDTGKERTRGA